MTNTIIGSGLNTGPSYTVSASPFSVLQSTGVSNANWTTSNAYTITAPSSAGAMIGDSGKISLQGKNADIDINGKSMKDWMEKVEERLNLLTVNPDLESDWEELRELGKQYRALEKRIKEKMETWRKLNANDGDNR